MNNGFVDSNVHFLRVEGLASEFDLLGTSILAHLSALPAFFSKEDLLLGTPPTIQGLGLLFRSPRKMAGSSGWIGKAFEYAVADLFNSRSEPHYSLICGGIDNALSTEMRARVKAVNFNIERSSCIRVAWESEDAEELIEAFGRFKTLEDARRSIRGAADKYPGLKHKIDVVFCDRKAEMDHQQFVVLASLKVNRDKFLESDVRQAFHTFPLDLGITVETPRYKGIRVYEELGVPVVHLPMDVASGVHIWGMATKIVKAALLEGQKNALLRHFQSLFRQDTPETYWVEFLANRLQIELRYIVQEIRQTLHQTPGERVTPVPTVLGPEEDTVPDLVVP